MDHGRLDGVGRDRGYDSDLTSHRPLVHDVLVSGDECWAERLARYRQLFDMDRLWGQIEPKYTDMKVITTVIKQF